MGAGCRMPSTETIMRGVHDRFSSKFSSTPNSKHKQQISPSSSADATSTTIKDPSSSSSDSSSAAEVPDCKALQGKPVGRLNIEALLKMETATSATSEAFAKNIGFLLDINRYDKVKRTTARNVPYTSLSMDDIDTLRKLGVIAKIDPARVQGGMKLFTVREPAKNRRRAIKVPTAINDADLEIPACDQATKVKIIDLVHKGEYALESDMMQYFDQFEQHPDVSALMCFKKSREFFCQSTMAMGARQSPAVAHSTTEKLADFPGRECAEASIIDNHIMIGKTNGAVLRDGLKWAGRVKEAGATLNEDLSTVEKIADRITSRLDWGGVGLDLINKTVTITEKVRRKLAVSCRSSPCCRCTWLSWNRCK